MSDLKSLNLSYELENKIMKVAHQNRMQYEIWIESAPNFKELSERLKKRGYKLSSISAKTMFPFYLNSSGNNTADVAALKKLSGKSMMQRGSSKR